METVRKIIQEHRGLANAVKTKDLCLEYKRRTGHAINDRGMRHMIAALVAQGEDIGGLSEGHFMIVTEEDRERVLANLLARANKIIQRVRHLDRRKGSALQEELAL